jgi:hypothetical protein
MQGSACYHHVPSILKNKWWYISKMQNKYIHKWVILKIFSCQKWEKKTVKISKIVYVIFIVQLNI